LRKKGFGIGPETKEGEERSENGLASCDKNWEEKEDLKSLGEGYKEYSMRKNFLKRAPGGRTGERL